MTFITSEMVVLSVMVSSRIPTKSVQIVHVMTFFGSEMNKNNFRIRNSYFCFFVKICGEQLNTHIFLMFWTFCMGLSIDILESNERALLRLCFEY